MKKEEYKKIAFEAQKVFEWVYDTNDLIENKLTGDIFKIVFIDINNVYIIKTDELNNDVLANDFMQKFIEFKKNYQTEKVQEFLNEFIEVSHDDFYKNYNILLTHTHVYYHFLIDNTISSDLNEYLYGFFQKNKMFGDNVYDFYANFIIAYIEYKYELIWSIEEEKFIQRNENKNI